MSHGISKTDLMVYLTGTGVPWHNLGRAENAIDLDLLKEKMSKRKRKLPYVNPVTGEPSEISFVITDDSGFEYGAVGADYTIYQDVDFWEAVWTICQALDLKIETASTLFGGRKIFAMATLPKSLSVANGDLHTQYVGFLNTFDGSLEVCAFGTTVRMVCNNTVTAAYSEATRKKNFFFSVPHTRNVSDQVQAGIKTTIEVIKRLQRFKSIADALADYSVEREEAERIAKMSLDLLIPSWQEDAEKTERQKRKGASVLDTVLDLYMMEQAQCGAWYPVTENAYLLTNALTDYVERAPRYRGDSLEKQEKQFVQQVIGKHAETKSNILDLVISQTVGEKVWLSTSH